MGKSGKKMFIGQYEHSIDYKGRIAIPSKFRKIFKKDAIITKGLDGCLFLFDREKWEKMAKSISELPLGKSSGRMYARLMLSSATDVEFDNQGRINVPTFLKSYARLSDKVVVTGLYDRVEIWNKQAWTKTIKKVDIDAGKIAEELSEIGI